MSREDIERIVRESRAAQGLPPRIEDPTTLTKVAGLVRLDVAVTECLDDLLKRAS